VKTTTLLVVSAILSCGCGDKSDVAQPTPVQARVAADGTPLMDGFALDPPPDDAMQVVSPIIEGMAPGSNVELCYYSKYILDQDVYFRAGQGFQSEGGHHVVMYWTTVRQKENAHECTEDDMIRMHFLAGGGGANGNGVINGLPEGGVFRVPAGAQLVMNLHHINTTSKTIAVQSAVNLFLGDPKATPLTDFFVSGTDFEVAPLQTTTYEASCVAPRDLQVVRLLGHMHEWGSRSEILLDDGTGPKLVYDEPGAEDFSFNPPFEDYPISEPLTISKGTTITARCTWQNPDTEPLGFPTEMCAAFA
jgi:hypothetical protein